MKRGRGLAGFRVLGLIFGMQRRRQSQVDPIKVGRTFKAHQKMETQASWLSGSPVLLDRKFKTVLLQLDLAADFA